MVLFKVFHTCLMEFVGFGSMCSYQSLHSSIVVCMMLCIRVSERLYKERLKNKIGPTASILVAFISMPLFNLFILNKISNF